MTDNLYGINIIVNFLNKNMPLASSHEINKILYNTPMYKNTNISSPF